MGEGNFPGRGRNFRRLILYVAVVAWFVSMAFVGFFFPYFVDSSPLFKAQRVEIEGNRLVPAKEVREVVGQLGDNWLLISESALMEKLKDKTGNSVKGVELSRTFSSKGINLKVRVEERVPVALLSVEGRSVLVDKTGEVFSVKYLKEDFFPVVYLHGAIDRQFFVNLYNYVIKPAKEYGLGVREIYVSEDKVVLYSGSKKRVKVILPPVEFIDSVVAQRLKLIGSLRSGTVDLRYNKFLLVN